MAITFYATNNFTGDGTTVNWNINFADGYIDTTNVKARYLDNTGSYVDIAISSVAGNVVTISPAVANGQVFQIYRDTEKRFPLVDFSDGAILNETNLDTLATQAVMVSAEAFDQSNNGVLIAGDALNTATGIAATANLALSNSETALTTANGIASTANTALANSNTAIATANNASSVANGIAATADAALQNSATALSTANDASDTANAIAGTANSALSTAQDAETAANSALSTVDAIANTKANKGANSDITSLSGLTTALSVAQGGTGATTAAGVRSNLSLGSAALKNTGVSGDAVPLLNANNTWSGIQTLNQPLGISSGGTGATTAAGALAALGATGRLLSVTKLTASGTYTTPAGATSLIVELCGGGGGGGGNASTTSSTMSMGAGGSSAAYVLHRITSPLASYNYSVGAGGTGVSGGTGGTGGDSSFGSVCSAVGGPGGTAITPGTDVRFITANQYIGDGYTGGNIHAMSSRRGNGGTRFSGTTATSGAGSDSPLGSGGAYTVGGGTSGNDASGYGAGGSGSCSTSGSATPAQPGGAGSPGTIIVYAYS